MPELPEVETIRRGLNKFLLGRKITGVEILCEKSFQGPAELVTEQTISGIRRRGKALLLDLENEITLMIHLRMTGQLIYRARGTERGADLMEVAHQGKLGDEESFAGGHPTDAFFTELPNRQTRVILTLGEGATASDEGGQILEAATPDAEAGGQISEVATPDGEKQAYPSIIPQVGEKVKRGAASGASEVAGHLYFNDQRKFGFIKVIPTTEVEQDSFIKSLAPEPWQMGAAEFHRRLRRHPGAPVKAVILDQKVVAGLGNIYADEALFMAEIHPCRPAGSLSATEARRLLEAACTVMERSIESGGSTMATYVRADGTRGNYLEQFAQVFRREGEPCPRCGAEIVKIRVAGRGTHVCVNCQKEAPDLTSEQKSGENIPKSAPRAPQEAV